MVLNAIGRPQSSGSGVFPALVLVQGTSRRILCSIRTPFSVGRKVDKDLVIADPRVSRDHALIVLEEEGFFSGGSGQQAWDFRQRGTGATAEAGAQRPAGIRGARFDVCDFQSGAWDVEHGARLSQPDLEIRISQEATDLEKLTLFLEAARKLNTAGVLDEILMTMLEVTLRLTRAERGYVFLKDDEGKLRLAAGRNSKGESLLDDKNDFAFRAGRVAAVEFGILVDGYRQLGGFWRGGKVLWPTICGR